MTPVPALRSATTEHVATLASFRDAHRGETIIVCGCGESLNLLEGAERFITIGVNDVGRRFTPDYLVVVNPRSQFAGDRFHYVETSRATALFTHLDLGVPHPRVVRFRLGRYGGTDASDPNALHYTRNSPYVAICLAVHMGARRIGLLGVDFTEHHFFGRTGIHHLARRLSQIDGEYGRLAEQCRARGIEIVNVSPVSRLTALPRATLDTLAPSAPAAAVEVPRAPGPAVATPAPAPLRRRVFFVNYRFLACGDVFATGLAHAADALGVEHDAAWWDDGALPAKIRAFAPDLVFVVHGRRAAQRWAGALREWKSAVWLLDEPYEVDDTSRWSSTFGTVFVNDPATLARHRNAHPLPVCFDPLLHRDAGLAREHQVGFIGGYNPVRERYLVRLADEGLLSYVIGGSWKAAALRSFWLAERSTPAETAQLYQRTQIVLNVFRSVHHFNRDAVAATSLNPRIFEALACGAGVVSERRAEVAEVFPELPQFDTPDELLAIVQRLLANRDSLAALRRQCAARLVGHGYHDRLSQALALTLPPAEAIQYDTLRVRRECGDGAAMENPTESTPRTRLAPAPLQRPATRATTPVMPLVAANPPLAPRLEPLPFATFPKRNLLYHVWPVRGSTWRWNLDELKRRIDLFNGKRIIGIVCDERSEPPEAVQIYLDGHGCEYVTAPNDERGEAATFPLMLERVASTLEDELSFYAHAKGVKYEPQFPRNVRRWAEVQYGVTLDDWLGVKEQLQRYAMTGPFRRHGRFPNHGNAGDWHYSGTFFWMRHAHVFKRQWQDVPQFYGGVEAWPGMHFHRDETGCLLLDNLRDLPYHDRFWTQRGDLALRRWQAAVGRVPTPTDLATPKPFEGHTWPRLEQKPQEFARWIELLLEHRVASLLSIGAQHGGVEWHVARAFHARARRIEITAVVPRESPELTAAIDDARHRFDARIRLLIGHADAAALQPHLPQRCDAVFIDGDHGYQACNADFRLAQSRGPALIGLHDIVDSDWHAANRCCVSRLWAEIVAQHTTEEIASGEWGGIGVVKSAVR